LTLLHIAARLVMVLSGVLLLAKFWTQKERLSDLDYLIICGLTLGLLLGFIFAWYRPSAAGQAGTADQSSAATRQVNRGCGNG
jgi:hypothetical protein